MTRIQRLLHALGRHVEHRCWHDVQWWMPDRAWDDPETTREVHCKVCEPYRYHESVTLKEPLGTIADVVYRSREDAWSDKERETFLLTGVAPPHEHVFDMLDRDDRERCGRCGAWRTGNYIVHPVVPMFQAGCAGCGRTITREVLTPGELCDSCKANPLRELQR